MTIHNNKNGKKFIRIHFIKLEQFLGYDLYALINEHNTLARNSGDVNVMA